MMNATHPTTELLAPAGDFESLRAAVGNGADAVYFGLSEFNARRRATNFTVESLVEVMGHLHAHNVRGYVALNTLIFADELPEARRLVVAIAEAGADAVIVQDIGLARLIREICPELPIHGSTQMTLTDARGIGMVRGLGVERVILARELSVDEIAAIREKTDTAVEAFIHGALCVSYSGQCLTSEAIGGRSANRGQCAQACRLPYELIVDGAARDLGERAYLLSPQDLAGDRQVDRLVRMGVAALKIEGRLKSAHYVAATTRAYRLALDAALAGKAFELDAGARLDLTQSFSRGFTAGFLDGVDHQALVPARFPKARGVRVGVVESAGGDNVIVRVESHGPGILKPGDGVVFDEGHPDQDEQGGRVYRVSAAPGRAGRLEIALGSGQINAGAISPGAIVWRTDDPAMRKRLERSYARDQVVHRIPLDAAVRARVGERLRATFSDGEGRTAVAEWDRTLERAEKHPIDEATVREQFSRLGDSPYALRRVALDTDGAMAPKSVLNDLRRRAVGELVGRRSAGNRSIRRDDVLAAMRGRAPAVDATAPASWYVLTRTPAQLRAALEFAGRADPRPAMVYCDFEDVRGYGAAVAAARAAGMPIGLATLRVVKPGEDGLLKQVGECGPDAIVVRNLSAVAYYREHFPAMAMIGDHTLNVANDLSADWLRTMGLTRVVPSHDLNWSQLTAMLGRIDPAMFEQVIHQHMAMFHMEHCVFAATLSSGHDHRDCGRPCDRHRVELRDRAGQPHPLVPDVGCRNTLYNAAAQSAAEYLPRMRAMGLRHFRVELLRESADETRRLLGRYAELISGRQAPAAALRHLRVMNHMGVTPGTLDHE